MSNTISITLRIKDKNIAFEDRIEERKFKGKNFLFYFAKLSYTPEQCELCGKKNINYSVIKNGVKKSRLTIPKVSEMPVYLVLEKQRFYCKNCCNYFTATTFIVEKDCYISENTRLVVLNKGTEIRSQKSIVDSCYVGSTTVSRMINKAASQIAQKPFSYLQNT